MNATADDTGMLRLELELAREERTLFRSLLMIDEAARADFFARAALCIERMRATLRLPTREDAAFRDKIERLLAELGHLDTAARVLQLPTVLQRLQSCAQVLSQLQARATVSGNDLLPAMVLIENLCSHIAIGADAAGMASPLDPPLRVPAIESTAAQAGSVSSHMRVPPTAALALALRRLVTQVAAQHGRQVTLKLAGLEAMPPQWAHTLFDVIAQLARNAIEHGIETPAQRSVAGKAASGVIALQLQQDDDGLMLAFEDDGHGLDVERIAASAVGNGLLAAPDATALGPRRLASLIFQNGLTTAAQAGHHGTGMGIVREQVHRLGGQVQVASKRGQFTRFHIRLPHADTRSGQARAI